MVNTMGKLMLQCECGQEMTVPDSALGRRGLCPECGKELLIGDQNTFPWQPRARRPSPARPQAAVPPEQAWRRFAEAVDLYAAGRFAEALAVLNQLRLEFPDDQSILDAQRQCLEALERSAAPIAPLADAADAELTPELVRKVILEKMLRGGTESVQLQAAELAARLLGMFPATHDLRDDAGPTPTMLPDAPASVMKLLPERLARQEAAAQPPMASAEEVRQLTEMLDAIRGLHHPEPKNGGASALPHAEVDRDHAKGDHPEHAATGKSGGRKSRSATKSRRRAADTYPG